MPPLQKYKITRRYVLYT